MTDDAKAVSLYLSGMNLSRTAEKLGRSNAFVKGALRRADVQQRVYDRKAVKHTPTKPRAALVVQDGVGYIPTSDGKVFLVDEADVALVAQYSWNVGVNGIPRASVGGKMTTIHRLLRPDWRECDHVSTDQLDNRRANLRECSRRQNVCNRGKAKAGTYSSRFKGVSLDKRRGTFTAQIVFEDKRHWLGSFATEEEAAAAYDAAAVALHGAFARTNKPSA